VPAWLAIPCCASPRSFEVILSLPCPPPATQRGRQVCLFTPASIFYVFFLDASPPLLFHYSRLVYHTGQPPFCLLASVPKGLSLYWSQVETRFIPLFFPSAVFFFFSPCFSEERLFYFLFSFFLHPEQPRMAPLTSPSPPL